MNHRSSCDIIQHNSIHNSANLQQRGKNAHSRIICKLEINERQHETIRAPMALKPSALKEHQLKKKNVQDFQCNEGDQNNKIIRPESDEVSEGRAN